MTELHATLDGVAIPNLVPASTPYYACAGPDTTTCAPAFYANLLQDNISGGAQQSALTVAEGFYLMLPPLSPGQHTLTFGGTQVVFGTAYPQEITYHLTVTP